MTASPGFTLARALRGGETVWVSWCTLPYPLVAELLGSEGFSAVVLDQQHGLWDTAATLAGIAAVHHGGAAPIVRVPVGDFATVSRALDFGAEAVIAPMINNAEDARAFVAAAKFPPIGERSWGPHRAMTFAGISEADLYLRDGNDLTVTLAMIETSHALDNLDAILATPGIDGVFVGPFDLSIALAQGRSVDPDSPKVNDALGTIADAANNAGKIAGIFCHASKRAPALAKRGFRFIAAGTDIGFLRAGLAASRRDLKR
jgi:4-hydroxy-2-oxoheptanedioate aldolase